METLLYQQFADVMPLIFKKLLTRSAWRNYVVGARRQEIHGPSPLPQPARHLYTGII